MKVNSLTTFSYTTWGRKYNQFEWRDEWKIFLRIVEREIRTIEFHKFFKTLTVSHILWFFDTQILQCIEDNRVTTLNVRIRILCGMINKLPTNVLTRDLKIQLTECIWDTYKKFKKSYEDWYCYYILGLPF